MVGSIDPSADSPWNVIGRTKVWVVWNSRRGNHLGQRYNQPRQQAGHMDASDPIRPLKNSCGTGAVHIWIPARSLRSRHRNDELFLSCCLK